jgi:transcriptional regulator with XRE-family HTH domain
MTLAPKKPNPIDIHVGSRVRMRRILAGMSQQGLGEALGITFQQVQKYEKGTNRISASRLQLISKVLEAPTSFFYEGGPLGDLTGDAAGFAEPTELVNFLSTVEGLQLNRAFTSIKDAKVRRRIVELVVAFAASENGDESHPGS